MSERLSDARLKELRKGFSVVEDTLPTTHEIWLMINELSELREWLNKVVSR